MFIKDMDSKIKNVKIFIILHVFFMVSSLFGISSKLAANEQFLSVKFIIYYGILLLNLGLYAVVWQQLIKRIPLVTAYANKAVGVVWGLVWGKVFFGESITITKLIGIIVIIAGIIFVVTDKEDEND